MNACKRTAHLRKIRRWAERTMPGKAEGIMARLVTSSAREIRRWARGLRPA